MHTFTRNRHNAFTSHRKALNDSNDGRFEARAGFDRLMIRCRTALAGHSGVAPKLEWKLLPLCECLIVGPGVIFAVGCELIE